MKMKNYFVRYGQYELSNIIYPKRDSLRAAKMLAKEMADAYGRAEVVGERVYEDTEESHYSNEPTVSYEVMAEY